MAPLSLHGRSHRMDHRDDSVRILAMCIWGVKQLRWVEDVHVRRLLPDEHEHHYRLFLRYTAGTYTLERSDESEIKI